MVVEVSLAHQAHQDSQDQTVLMEGQDCLVSLVILENQVVLEVVDAMASQDPRVPLDQGDEMVTPEEMVLLDSEAYQVPLEGQVWMVAQVVQVALATLALQAPQVFQDPVDNQVSLASLALASQAHQAHPDLLDLQVNPETRAMAQFPTLSALMCATTGVFRLSSRATIVYVRRATGSDRRDPDV